MTKKKKVARKPNVPKQVYILMPDTLGGGEWFDNLDEARDYLEASSQIAVYTLTKVYKNELVTV